MSFEESFANFGRRLDDIVWRLKVRPASGGRMRDVREAVSERVRAAREGAGEQLDRVRHLHLPSDDSPARRSWRMGGMIAACLLCTAAGLVLGPRLFGTAVAPITSEEHAAMQKIRSGASRTPLFTPQTPASPDAAPPGAPAGDPGALFQTRPGPR